MFSNQDNQILVNIRGRLRSRWQQNSKCLKQGICNDKSKMEKKTIWYLKEGFAKKKEILIFDIKHVL